VIEVDEQAMDEETTSNAIAPTVAHAEGATASRHGPSAGGSLSEVRPCHEQRDLSKEEMPVIEVDEQNEQNEQAMDAVAAAGGAEMEEAGATDPAVDMTKCTHIRYIDQEWQARRGMKGEWFKCTTAQIHDHCKPDTNTRLKNEFGLAIATNGGGQFRLCSAHAAYNIARNVRPELQSDRRASQPRFEKLLPGGLLPVDDPSVDDVKRVLLEEFRISATRLYNTSPRALVNFRDGVFLVRLELTYEGQAELGFHLTVYHAASGAVLDPDASDRESIVVNDDDRVHRPKGRKQIAEANEKAMRVFRAVFSVPSAIRLVEVYHCERA